MNLKIVCPKCRGKVMEDDISPKYMDLACVYCAKRWFIKKDQYYKWLKQLEKNFKKTAIISGI